MIDSAPLRGKRVLVAVPDATRPLDLDTTLLPLLGSLSEEAASIEVLVALGLHRPMSDTEMAPLRAICDRYAIACTQHDAWGADRITLADDVSALEGLVLPVVVHPSVARAEAIVCVGVVEPHQYAGFSGGVKTVAIGCAGAETIAAMHGLQLLRAPGTAVARIEGNPFQEALWQIASRLAPCYALEVVGDDAPRFGPARETFAQAVQRAMATQLVAVDRAYPWALLRVPSSKASNFYQASRAATYVALIEGPPVREGGPLVLEARCEEGVGQGAGERACAEAMRRGVEVLREELERGHVELRGGQQRAYVLAKALARHPIVVLGAQPLEELAAMGIAQFPDIEQACTALGLHPEEGLVVDAPFARLPQLHLR